MNYINEFLWAQWDNQMNAVVFNVRAFSSTRSLYLSLSSSLVRQLHDFAVIIVLSSWFLSLARAIHRNTEIVVILRANSIAHSSYYCPRLLQVGYKSLWARYTHHFTLLPQPTAERPDARDKMLDFSPSRPLSLALSLLPKPLKLPHFTPKSCSTVCNSVFQTESQKLRITLS